MRGRPIGLLVPFLICVTLQAAPTHVEAAVAVWPTYHLDAARSGNDTTEPSFLHLGAGWTAGPLDGQIYAEPLVYGNGVIAVTENNSIYSFDVASGAQQWHSSIGAPRTTNFPCGNIMPLGITSTPVIDGGFLYVVGDVEAPSGTYRFHMAKINPSTGSTSFNTDITPSGMTTSVQQQRSALAVSNGNVVVVWGGLDGDCGNYHGFVETVSESSGAPQAQWNNTPSGREGGMWAASGPAVDASGNIYVNAGNGSSTNINQYDYSDSVLRFAPTLGTPSFFAPGPPQDWVSLNAADQDLGSTGPSLLPNGLLFAIGKGGRGYLLTQTSLPNNSNPGGGANFDAQVCHRTSNAAFSGLAVAGSTVFVPCTDGVAAVSVDSSSAFHTLWYSTSGGSAPIVAGGLVWSLKTFGGSTLYGLDPSSGSLVITVALPATTNHFATPAAGDQRLFVPDGNFVVALAPPKGVGAPQVAVTRDGSSQLVFWQGASGHLVEAWWNGRWNGPVDWTAANSWGNPLNSAPGVAVTQDDSQLVFWGGTGGHLFEAWWNGHWNGPVDWTAANSWGSPLNSAPRVALAQGGSQLVFWEGPGGHLFEAWWNGRWNGPVDWTAAKSWGNQLNSAPSVAVAPDGTQLVFWQGSGGHLIAAWWNGYWNGPVDWTAANSWSNPLNSAPSVAVAPDGTQLVFWQGDGGHLIEAWWNGRWNGPVDWTAAKSWGNPLNSEPSAAAAPDGTQLVFWQGAGEHLIEAWWNGHWNGPVDWSSSGIVGG